MRTQHRTLTRVLAGAAVATLAACQADPTAPPTTVRPVIGQNCSAGLLSSVQRTVPAAPGVSLHTTTPPQLGGVTITASFPGGFGIPFNLQQIMNFPGSYGAELAPCFNSDIVQYTVQTAVEVPEDTPLMPDGVDPAFWNSLSPREKRVLISNAFLLTQLNPNRYPTIASAISQMFEEKMLRAKLEARLRAIDFYGASQEAEMMAGGVYGCQLYQRFVTSADWHYTNDATLDMVIQLVSAFAEAQFPTLPLRGLQFGRNGAVGAGLAAASALHPDCGRLIFDSIPRGSILVTDPYYNLPARGTVQPPANPGGPEY